MDILPAREIFGGWGGGEMSDVLMMSYELSILAQSIPPLRRATPPYRSNLFNIIFLSI
jgi:hypothetical protein